MRKPVKNLGASVRARLLNLAKERNQPFDLLLTRYTLERLLYRLSLSKHRNRFVLKGAMLLTSTMDDPHRPTRDLDLLGLGDPDPAGMIAVFREICSVEADDAVVFDIAGLTIDSIRDEAEYGGLRIRAHLLQHGAGHLHDQPRPAIMAFHATDWQAQVNRCRPVAAQRPEPEFRPPRDLAQRQTVEKIGPFFPDPPGNLRLAVNTRPTATPSVEFQHFDFVREYTS